PEVHLAPVQRVQAVGVQAGCDTGRVRRERPRRWVLRLDEPDLVAVGLEFERAPVLQVIRADARLTAGARAATVDRAAAVAVPDVRLPGSVRLGLGDHLGLAGGGAARGIALALAQQAAGGAD